MKTLKRTTRLASLALVLASTSASAVTINGSFTGFPNPDSGPGLDASWIFSGVTPAASPVTFTFRGTGNADGDVNTLDPFRLYGNAISLDNSNLIGTVSLDDPVDVGHSQHAQFLADALNGIYTLINRTITIPAATFNSFISGGNIAFHLTNPEMQDPSNDWFWFSSSVQQLSYTPVPLPAALPLFLSGLLLLVRARLHRKPIEATAAG